MQSPSLCLRCLSSALRATETTPSISRAFSTTLPKSRGAPKKIPSHRQTRSLRLSKKTRAPSGRPPQPGERKAIRKRVVLSNTNALKVRGLRDLDGVSATAAQLERIRGHVLGLNDATVDALRALDAFKPTQGWNLFSRPTTLIRDETVMFAKMMDETAGTTPRQNRFVLSGERGSGKSVLQLQAMALAQMKGWILIHIPEGKPLEHQDLRSNNLTASNRSARLDLRSYLLPTSQHSRH